MRKFVIYALNGDANCFLHVLLTVLDLDDKGYEVRLVIVGSAICLVNHPEEHGVLFASLLQRVQERGLIDETRLTCAMGTTTNHTVAVAGHPGMSDYLKDGYQVITF